MTDDARLVSTDVNVSNSINATTAEPSPGSLPSNVSRTNPMIVRVTIFLIMAVFSLGGNGFTLITIRLTRRLWTKTNFILASMLVADVINGVLIFWYAAFFLVLYVFNNPCRYNVVITALTPLMKMTPYVSIYHLILISIERYIAIVYPLQYETKFTDRTLKWGIASAWATGILVGMTFSFWLINADLSKCDLIPVLYQTVDVVFCYIPVCISMFVVYRKILIIWWRQRKSIEPISTIPPPAASVEASAVNTIPQTRSGNADNTQGPSDLLTGSEPPRESAATTETTSADTAMQHRQQVKSRRREFKAVYLTAAIVGMFSILWFPQALSRVLASVDYNPVVVNYSFASGAIGGANFAFGWVIYAAVSKSYRRAYRQILIRVGCCCYKSVMPQVDNSHIV